MANLRRSSQNKNIPSGPSPNRMPATLAPPRKVIKALYNYSTKQPEELSFSIGDFFHVIGNEDDEDWYEASNPITNARGYVPVAYFQVLEKSHRNSNQSLEDAAASTNDSGSSIYNVETSPGFGAHGQSSQQQRPTTGVAAASNAAAAKAKFQPLYGIVLYDFGAEKADELDAKVGDAILVIAQSNEEWYVAKPIGRLGGPGLIPVSYVQIRDMVTGKSIDVPEMLRKTGMSIPRVEEWKQQTMEYKANSIPLGKIEAGEAASQPPHGQQQQQQQQQQQYHQHSPHNMAPMQPPMSPQHFQQQQQHILASQTQTIQQLKNKLSRGDLKSQTQRDPSLRNLASQDFETSRRMTTGREEQSSRRATASSSRTNNNGNGYDGGLYPQDRDNNSIVNANVESYHHEDDQYWFSVRVELASGATRNLFRLYEDFYDFHIALLEEFPVESGRVGDQPRSLPFMPIPISNVDDGVTAARRSDLDGYVQDLCKLPSKISQHPLVMILFAVKDGDVEIPPGGSVSPSIGRSTPSQSMFHSPSPSAGARAVFGNKGQGSAGYRGYPDDPPSAGASPSLRSQASFQSPAGGPGVSNGGGEEQIKLKISYQEDIMAMRIPVSITFRALQQKVFERIQADQGNLSYRDEHGNFAPIQSDGDVREAIGRSGGKLMIYAD
ncbi:bud emergence protein 1 [Lunasporangiospora selenospora]|uniref:Bud emergence protein 1 n=1 Tax=Lunasporangiospora selenospora TaxID=979761 RepID=A0A9P6FWN3_9FUNG|nr:bud emergence protein 1 [Lunasporangiospora selenospora]